MSSVWKREQRKRHHLDEEYPSSVKYFRPQSNWSKFPHQECSFPPVHPVSHPSYFEPRGGSLSRTLYPHHAPPHVISSDVYNHPMYPPLHHSREPLHGQQSSQTFLYHQRSFPDITERWEPWLHNRHAPPGAQYPTEYSTTTIWDLQRSSGQYDAELYRSRNYPEQRDRWQFRGHGQFRGGYAGHVTMSPNRGIRFQPPNSLDDHSRHVSELSMAEKLQMFIEKLKMFPDKVNSIQTIENCITASHLPVKTSFVISDIVSQTDNRPVFSGALYIDDVYITRSTGSGKKQLKHTVYDVALQLLKTWSVEDIMAQNDPGESMGLQAEQTEIGPKNDLRSKLVKLQRSIKNSVHPKRLSVTVFETAFLESQCGLKHRYYVAQMKDDQGVRRYFTTKVLIEGKTLASAVANTEKESKAKACQEAVTIFTSTDVDTILEEHFNSDHIEDDVPQEREKQMRKRTQNVLNPPSCVPRNEQANLLDSLIQDLRLSVKEGANLVMIIDKNCLQLKIKLLIIYKAVHLTERQTSLTCDLYILDRLIAHGQGSTRKMAQSDTYFKSAEVLKNSKGSDILGSFPEFDEVELTKPDVVDYVHKGYGKTQESNRCRLNRLKQLPKEKQKASELIIIEHEDWIQDRKKHSRCILNQSATQCGCLLEWTTEPENGCFRCTMKLQGKEISSVVASKKKLAVDLASSVALFHFYETQPVIQSFHIDYQKIWVTRDRLLKCSQSLSEDSDHASTRPADTSQEVDGNISRAIGKMLDQFFSHETLEDFVEAPDWKPEEKLFLRITAVSRGLKAAATVYCDEQIHVISRKYDLSQMIDILEKQPTKSQGRYRLLPEEEKPSYNDIAGEIAANESSVKCCQTLAGPRTQGKPSPETAKAAEEKDIENCLNTDEVSVNSEDGDTYVTANSTFISAFMTEGTNMGKIISSETAPSIPPPNRSSTPLKLPADIFIPDIDKPDISTPVLGYLDGVDEGNWTTISRHSATNDQETDSHKLIAPSAVCRIKFEEEVTLLPHSAPTIFPSGFSSASHETNQQKKSSDSHPVEDGDFSQTNFSRLYSSWESSHPEDLLSWCSWQRWYQSKSRQEELNGSIDLEAGWETE